MFANTSDRIREASRCQPSRHQCGLDTETRLHAGRAGRDHPGPTSEAEDKPRGDGPNDTFCLSVTLRECDVPDNYRSHVPPAGSEPEARE